MIWHAFLSPFHCLPLRLGGKGFRDGNVSFVSAWPIQLWHFPRQEVTRKCRCASGTAVLNPPDVNKIVRAVERCYGGFAICRFDSHCEQNHWRSVSRRYDARVGPLVDSNGGIADRGRAGVFEARSAAAGWIHREGSCRTRIFILFPSRSRRENSMGWFRRIWRFRFGERTELNDADRRSPVRTF